MENFIASLKTQLLEQKKELGTNIKNSEDNLLRTKEGFLKVEGALEVISILETRIAEQSKDETVTEVVGSS